jgi:hypothetical protein
LDWNGVKKFDKSAEFGDIGGETTPLEKKRKRSSIGERRFINAQNHTALDDECVVGKTT